MNIPLSNDILPSNQLHALDAFIDHELAKKSTKVYRDSIAAFESYLIRKALNATNGNQTRAAELLGITRAKLRDRILQFNIQLERRVMIGS